MTGSLAYLARLKRFVSEQHRKKSVCETLRFTQSDTYVRQSSVVHLGQFFQRRLGLLQVQGVESFGEPGARD